jgi:phytoene dehydrogenase-like protein
MQRFNRNYIGGDINGGLAELGQLLFRPIVRLDPYATAIDNVFLCSSSTPPGGGVHGMCGYWAARTVLRKIFSMPGAPARSGRPVAAAAEQRTAAQ